MPYANSDQHKLHSLVVPFVILFVCHNLANLEFIVKPEHTLVLILEDKHELTLNNSTTFKFIVKIRLSLDLLWSLDQVYHILLFSLKKLKQWYQEQRIQQPKLDLR